MAWISPQVVTLLTVALVASAFGAPYSFDDGKKIRFFTISIGKTFYNLVHTADISLEPEEGKMPLKHFLVKITSLMWKAISAWGG